MFKKTLKIIFVLYFFVLPMIGTRAQSDVRHPLLVNDEYNIEIIALQWEFRAIDLNRVNYLVNNGMNSEDARDNATYTSTIGLFIVGKNVNFAIRSRDVQHGFSISYIDESETEVSLAVAITRPAPNEMYGSFTNATFALPSTPMTLNAFCHIFCGLGHPDMKIEFQIVNSISVESALGFQGIGLILTTFGVIAALSFAMYKIQTLRLQDVVEFNQKQRNIISEIFRSRSSLYYYMMGHKSLSNARDQERLEQAVPQDIFQFKFLLHPVRLSMTKLLFENLKMTTVELKNVLGISWNDVNTHLAALQKKGYIHSQHQFIDGSRKQVVTLETFGIEQYKILIDLLHLFLDNVEDYQINFDDQV